MKFQKISLLSFLCILFSANLLAVDGVVLINNATVMAAGGYPYSITQPGSYKLSGNLTIPDANTDAIQIKTDDVTLDLNGFIISGPEVCILGTYPVQCSAQSTALGYGVNAGANIGGRNNITVMNGTIRGMGAGAVILFGHGEVVDRVRAEGNAAFIPDLDGAIYILDGTVTRCTITGNAAHGILAFDFHSVGAFFALITQNSISFNGGDGILGGNVVSNNNIFRNGESGIENASLAVNNSVIGNIGFGIKASDASFAFLGNVLQGSPVNGGTSLGHNLCNSTPC